MYNWQDSSGLYGDRVSETLRGYHNLDRVVRELYVSYRTHNLDLVIGKQQIAWGKMDGRYIDTINAIDNREGAQVEANGVRVPAAAGLHAEYDVFLWRQLAQLLVDPAFRARPQRALRLPLGAALPAARTPRAC